MKDKRPCHFSGDRYRRSSFDHLLQAGGGSEHVVTSSQDDKPQLVAGVPQLVSEIAGL
jgi:hypothetical protein